jgi:hypothetical protein
LVGLYDWLLDSAEDSLKNLAGSGPEERKAQYKRMGLRVQVDEHDDLHISRALPTGESVCETKPLRVLVPECTKNVLRFSARFDEDAPEVRFERIV